MGVWDKRGWVQVATAGVYECFTEILHTSCQWLQLLLATTTCDVINEMMIYYMTCEDG